MTVCQDFTESLSIPKSLTPVFQHPCKMFYDDTARQVIDEVTITSYVKKVYKMNLAWLCHFFYVCRKGLDSNQRIYKRGPTID